MVKKNLNFDFSSPPPPPKEEKPVDAEVVESTPFDTFDLVAAQKHASFVEIQDKLTDMRQQVAVLKITDDASSQKAMEMQVQLKVLVKSATESKQNLASYKTAADFKNGMDKFVREHLVQPLESLDNQIKPKIRAYQLSVAELERRKAAKEAAEVAEKARKEAEEKAKADKDSQEKERQEAIALQQKLNLEADEADVPRVQVPIPEAVEQPVMPLAPEVPAMPQQKKVVTDHGSAKTEMVWVCIIKNPDDVPRLYCSPDQDKLDDAVERGVREIPGCEIIQEPITRIRVSRKRKSLDLSF